MLFNSIEFAIFFPLVFGIYWLIPNGRLVLKNALILFASYVFYGWWDWRFLSLIIVSSLVDFTVGVILGRCESQAKRKLLLAASILTNLGLLGVFKYFNFFLDNINAAFTFLGTPIDGSRLDIVLPVGISFYTFQTMSYSIDVYRKKMKPVHDPLAFFAYVAFFPQLVAGPIERAVNLLPQFSVVKTFDYERAVDGLRQILWGLFKKVVIADNCAVIVDAAFSSPESYSSSTLVLAAILFAFQIYCDFSGYSDIAIGSAKLLGFNLKQNFAYPYFSRDISEFWRRWHISLTSWFRDYLYIPLGGSRGAKIITIRNTVIVFLVSGFWHGANWTFIFWGGLHALFFMPLLLSNSNRRHMGDITTKWPRLPEFLGMCYTFLLVDIAWIFFRADSVEHAFLYLSLIPSGSLLSKPAMVSPVLLLCICGMLIVEWGSRHNAHGLGKSVMPKSSLLRKGTYMGLGLIILLFGGSSDSFIYFQF